ncbi:unnamed protein product [Auanema sp. JU1783]|nr:unnamed protein product [Auanema sp. JU1783]
MDVDIYQDEYQTRDLIRDEKTNFVQNELVFQNSLNCSGTRLLLCGADGRLSIWNLKDNGQWQLAAQWEVHGSPVVEGTWAHPEFGDLIATRSADKSVYIWQEIPSSGKSNKKWMRKAFIPDSTDTVTSFAFGPRHLGLVLATANVRGEVLVYEAINPMDTCQWKLIHSLQPFYARCSSISWSSSPVHKVLLAVATDDSKLKRDQRVIVYEMNETLKKFQHLHNIRLDLPGPVFHLNFSPIITQNGHELVVSAGEVFVFNLRLKLDEDETETELPETSDISALKICSLGLGGVGDKWKCKFLVDGNTIIASNSSGVRIFRSNLKQKWTQVAQVNADTVTKNISKCHSTKGASGEEDDGPGIIPAVEDLAY